jgi:hypothetical protein
MSMSSISVCQVNLIVSACFILPFAFGVFLYSQTHTRRLKRLVYEQQLKINHHVTMYEGLAKMYEGITLSFLDQTNKVAILEATQRLEAIQRKELTQKYKLSDEDIERITERVKHFSTIVVETNQQMTEALLDYPKSLSAKELLKKVLSKFNKS